MSVPPAKTNATAGVVKSPPPVRVRTRPAQRSEDNAGSIPEDKGRGSAKAGYEVGYGKPPKHSRFKPGQSGNPKGRPKSAMGLNTIVRTTLTQKVAVRTSAGERKISRIEAVVQKTIELAMKGNPRALAEIIKLYGNAVPDEPHSAGHDQRDEDLTATDLAILEELRQQLAHEGE